MDAILGGILCDTDTYSNRSSNSIHCLSNTKKANNICNNRVFQNEETKRARQKRRPGAPGLSPGAFAFVQPGKDKPGQYSKAGKEQQRDGHKGYVEDNGSQYHFKHLLLPQNDKNHLHLQNSSQSSLRNKSIAYIWKQWDNKTHYIHHY